MSRGDGFRCGAQIKRKFPEAYTKYKSLYNKVECSYDLLGECQVIFSNGKMIANLFGQFDCGSDENVVYTDYNSLSEALRKLGEEADMNKATVALPYNLGCVRGNGDWTIVLKLIEKHIPNAVLYRLDRD